MALGTLSIDLVAKLAKFEADMGKAARAAELSAQRMAKAFDLAKSNLASLGVTLSGAVIVALSRSLIDAVDALNDLKDATGSSIENLSALEDVANRTGATMDTVGAALVKFNGVLKDIKPDSNAERALTALGLSAKELKALDPSEALRRLAVALSGFADDANKARILQELFGKSLREVAPFLGDLAKQGELVARVTGEQAEEAEKFNLQLFRMQAESRDAGRALALEFLPAVNDALALFNRLKSSGNFLTFLGEAVVAPFGIAEISDRLTEDLNRLTKRRDDLVERFNKGKGIDFRGLLMSGTDIEAEIKRVDKLIAVTRDRLGVNAGQAGGGRGFVNPGSVKTLPTLPDSVQGNDAAKRAAEALQKAYESLSSSVRARVAEQEKELEVGRPLRESEKLRLQLASDLESKLKGLSKANQDSIRADIEKLALGEKVAEQRKRDVEAFERGLQLQQEEADALKAQYDARTDAYNAVNDYVRAIMDETELLELQQSLAGKSQEDREIAIAQYRVQLDLKRKLLEIDRDSSLNEEDRAALRAKATTAALQAAANVETQANMDRTKALGDSIEQGIMSGFRDGKGAADIFLSELKAQFAKTVLRPLIQPIAEAGSSLISSGLKSLFGGFFADGGIPPMGKVSVVGEKGPELFVPNTAGRIVPNSALGGVGQNITVNITQTVGDVATVSMLQKNNQQLVRQIHGGLMRSQNRGGALS